MANQHEHSTNPDRTIKHGSANYTLYIPRKALDLLKERHGNTAAIIRGMIADYLGDEWPDSQCYKANLFMDSHHKLKVIRPSELAQKEAAR